MVKEGTEIFTNIQNRIDKQLERLEAAINTIREACKKEGVVLPELETAVNEANKLRVFKAKMDRYMNEIKNEQADIEKRVAYVSVMVELSDAISLMEQK